MSASGLYCKKSGVASRQHMYLTDSKLNLPVQTARKLVLAPSPFDDYLEMNPTRRSRIFVHRVSAINKPKNTLRPDNPGGGGGDGRREGRETIEYSPPNSVSRGSSPAGDAICVLRCLVVDSLSFFSSRGLWFPPQAYVCNGLWRWVGRLPCIGPKSPVRAHHRKVGRCTVKVVKRKTRF